MPGSNRRVASRRITCVAVGVEVKNKQQLALIRDASTSGAMLFTRKALTAGDKLTISIQFDTNSSGVEVVGQVVRTEKLKDGFWSFAVAVTFDPPRDDLTSLFDALAEQQERLFGSHVPAPRPSRS